MTQPPPDLDLVYVGDPMCSWCWGFAPTLAAVQARFTLPLRLVLGGLRPGAAAETLTHHARARIADHWHHVEVASGQPFDHGGLDDRPATWRYDTELASIAVVTLRTLAPAHALDFYHRLQRAFYAERVDLTDPAVYPPLLDGFPVSEAAFTDLFGSRDMKELAWADFAFARKLGVHGFPTLLLREGSSYGVVSPGWSSADKLIPALEAWLTTHHPAALSGLLCDLESGTC